jgi:hypothetical protein
MILNLKLVHIMFFSIITPCGLVSGRERFLKIYCIHLQYNCMVIIGVI